MRTCTNCRLHVAPHGHPPPVCFLFRKPPGAPDRWPFVRAFDRCDKWGGGEPDPPSRRREPVPTETMASHLRGTPTIDDILDEW